MIGRCRGRASCVECAETAQMDWVVVRARSCRGVVVMRGGWFGGENKAEKV